MSSSHDHSPPLGRLSLTTDVSSRQSTATALLEETPTPVRLAQALPSALLAIDADTAHTGGAKANRKNSFDEQFRRASQASRTVSNPETTSFDTSSQNHDVDHRIDTSFEIPKALPTPPIVVQPERSLRRRNAPTGKVLSQGSWPPPTVNVVPGSPRDTRSSTPNSKFYTSGNCNTSVDTDRATDIALPEPTQASIDEPTSTRSYEGCASGRYEARTNTHTNSFIPPYPQQQHYQHSLQVPVEYAAQAPPIKRLRGEMTYTNGKTVGRTGSLVSPSAVPQHDCRPTDANVESAKSSKSPTGRLEREGSMAGQDKKSRNREAARRCRERKMNKLITLPKEIETLQRKNEELRRSERDLTEKKCELEAMLYNHVCRLP
eukprot:CFRG2950T1